MNRMTPLQHDVRYLQRGLSLVELMVAVVLGLVLTAGIIQLFVGSKQAYRFHDAHSRVQENARFAIDALNFDIRMAGSVGCSTYVQTFNNTLTSGNLPATFNPGVGIEGWEAAGTGPGITFTLPAINAAVVDAGVDANWSTSGGSQLDAGTWSVPGSDVIRIWRADPNTATITNIAPGAPTLVTVTANTNIQEGDIVLLTDCQNADWVQACAISANIVTLSDTCSPGNVAASPLQTQVDGQAVRLDSFIYYVGKRGNDSTSPPGLFRRPLGVGVPNSAAAGVPEEVVEGVESMQVLYGVDLTGDRRIDAYRPANNVPNWNDVVSVQIALLMVASERGDDISGATSHTLLDTTANATADGRLRQVYTTSITLRNRVQ